MSLYYENELLHVIEKCIRCFKKWKCFGDSQHIKTMLKSEENEVLALYGGGRNMLSQNTKIGMLQYGLPGSLEMFEGYIKNLWAAAPK